MDKRAVREGWSARKRLVTQAARRLETEINAKTEQIVRDELGPWIEEQKRKFTRKGFQVASKGIERVEKMLNDRRKPDAKEESFIAKSAETYHRIGRVALGMTDGSSQTGAVSVNVLTNQAAVQVIQPET